VDLRTSSTEVQLSKLNNSHSGAYYTVPLMKEIIPVEMWVVLMVCSAASASAKAGLAAFSFSSATTLSAYNINMMS